jgi:hypothetical protein
VLEAACEATNGKKGSAAKGSTFFLKIITKKFYTDKDLYGSTDCNSDCKLLSSGPNGGFDSNANDISLSNSMISRVGAMYLIFVSIKLFIFEMRTKKVRGEDTPQLLAYYLMITLVD